MEFAMMKVVLIAIITDLDVTILFSPNFNPPSLNLFYELHDLIAKPVVFTKNIEKIAKVIRQKCIHNIADHYL